MRAFSVLVLSMVVAGCASTVAPTSETTEATRIVDTDIVRKTDGRGILIVKRDPAAFMGRGCDHDISLDGKLVASLRPNERVTMYPMPGDHIISLKLTNVPLCQGNFETQTTVAAGQTRTFRTTFDQGGGVAILPTAY